MALDCAAMLQHGIVLLILGPLLPEVMESFAIGEARTGMLLSIGSLGFMAGPIVAGLIIDRRGVRLAFLVGLLIEIAFLILFGYSPLFIFAVVANFAIHFGAAFVETAANVVPTLIPSKNSAHATMNYVHLFFSIGAFLGPLFVGFYLEATSNWRGAYLLILVPTSILLVGIILTRFPKPALVSRNQKSKKGLALVINRMTIMGALTLATYVGAEIGFSAWLVLYLRQSVGFSTIQATSGLALLWITIMIGRYVNGVLGNRVSARLLVVASGIVGGLGVVILLAVEHIVLVYIVLSVVGLALAGVFPNVMAEINRRDPGRAGSITAVMSTGAAAGAAIFQWLMGIVAENASLRAAFLIPAALQFISVVTFLMALSGDRDRETLAGRTPSDYT